MIFPLCVAATAVAGAFVVAEKAAGRRALLVAFLALATLGMASADQMERYQMGLGEDGWDRTRHPVELMDRAAEMPGETFVSDGLAGTWLWRNFRGSAVPAMEQRRVLIHNCLECYQEDTYKDVYQWIRYGKQGWDEKVRSLGIRSFLLKHTTSGERKMQEGAPNIRQHLYQSSDWILVDFDDVASLYVLWSELPQGGILLETAERPFPVDPDSWRPRKDTTPWEPIRQALLDHSATHPDSIRSLMIVGQLAFQTRDVETLARAAKGVAARRPGSSQAESLLGLLEGLAPR